jgi:HD-GYP domain-containing protein (c-di-GMP phosphodiesterase class II)
MSSNPALDQLLERAEQDAARPLTPREWRVEGAFAAGYLVVAAAIFVLLPSGRPFDPLVALGLIAAFAVATRVQFDVGAGYTIPIQLVFVPMLFVLPLPAVPVCALMGWLLGTVPDYVRRRTHPGRVALVLGNAWLIFGPVLVLWAAGLGDEPPSWNHWPVYLLALAAQIAIDFVVSVARARFALGVSSLAAEEITWIYAVDVLLAPIGLLAAFASAQTDFAFLLVLPLCGLLWLFGLERRVRMKQALALSHAYRGTAMLLGDMVEDDDEYTGAHSRGVLELALQVADELGLDARERRDLEFAALLHDVGKVSIPNEIINKAGPLTHEEMALVRTHTLEGHRILGRFGGVLGEVGRIVRSCHERWDGGGYPDGLAGDRIPRAARIIFACDALNAMTTDRSYRTARPLHEALEELRAHAGTQFDPEVVGVIFSLLSVPEPEPDPVPAPPPGAPDLAGNQAVA